MQGMYGYASDYGEIQEIALNSSNNKEEMHLTLIHEMVHVWQAQQGKKMNHKKSFRKWENRIGKNIR